MAQGNKSRIIIWTIVGILVVIAVVMLVTKPKSPGRPITAEELARSYQRSFDRVEKRVATAQSRYPGAPAEQWQKMSEGIARGRDILSRVPGLTDQPALAAKRESLKNAYVSVTKSLKEVTGQGSDAESDGGE